MHRTGRGVLGNKPASGTEIIQELGEEHQRTGKWIVYTSADSVFQIAAHEETIPLEELYAACEIAREILTGKHAVGRVIARPFVGEPGNYVRTPNRHDWSLKPRQPNYLTLVREAGAEVHGVGKIPDIFAGCRHRPRTRRSRTSTGSPDRDAPAASSTTGLVFTNLVETDMLWGHRNDPVNFHRCLQDFDRRLPDLLEALRRATCSSSPPTTAATRPRRRPTTRASTPCSSRTSQGGTRPGGSTRGSSPTSARPSTPGSAARRRLAASPASRSSSRVSSRSAASRDPPGGAHRAEARRRRADRRGDRRARPRLRAAARSPTTRWPRSAWPSTSAGSTAPRRSR